MELKEIITIVTSTFAAGITLGGLIVAIYKHKREGKHDNIDYAEKVVKFYEKRDKKLVERIKCLEEKIESFLKAEKDYKTNLERWSEYAKQLEHTIKDYQEKIVILDNKNEKLKKCCAGS